MWQTLIYVVSLQVAPKSDIMISGPRNTKNRGGHSQHRGANVQHGRGIKKRKHYYY